jgi:ubiquinone/menaquinone biosynthesis C-methylase UbiE
MVGTAAWDRYWRSDRIASCMDGVERSNYDDRVAAGWRTFFKSLPSGSRILDLCTGNGAVAVIAAEASAINSKEFAVTGVDLADIDPRRFVHRLGVIARDISFLARTSVEQLPFADASFDAAVSQYGIEYSNLDKSLAEAVRVLAPGGRLRLFTHAKDGTVAAATKRAIADADFLLERAKLCDKAAACFRTVHAVEAGDECPEAVAKADRCFAAFKAALDAAARHLDKAEDETMVRNTTAVLLHTYEHRRQFPDEVLAAKAQELKEEILAHRARQRQLVSAAVNASRLAQMTAFLNRLGMDDVVTVAVRPGAEFVGYVIEATKRRA